jgi:glutamate transport system permease protein
MSGPDALRFSDPLGPRGRRRVLIASIAATAVLAGLLAVALSRFAAKGQLAGKLWTPMFTGEAFNFFLTGLGNTVRVAVTAGLMALVGGVLLAVLRLSPVRPLRWLVIAWIEFFRGIPLILLVIFLYLGLPQFGIDPGRYWFLVWALALYNSAVIAEIVRAGILSLDRGQTEAGLAVGLTRGQALRHVVLPQALRRMLPALVSQVVVILKDSSLGFTIGYEELLRRSQIAGTFLGNPLQAFILGAAIYLVINLIFSQLARWLEGRQRRVRPDDAPVIVPITDMGNL